MLQVVKIQMNGKGKKSIQRGDMITPGVKFFWRCCIEDVSCSRAGFPYRISYKAKGAKAACSKSLLKMCSAKRFGEKFMEIDNS